MATAAAQAMSSSELHRKFSNPRPSINVTDIRPADIYPRYESEEEEISEAEVSGRTESVFSPIENDSDTGVSEPEEMGSDSPHLVHQNYTSEDEFPLQIPIFPASEATISRAGSINTVKRASCITLMPPLQPQPTKPISMASSTSTSTSPPMFPAIEPIFSTNHAAKTEALQYFRSLYSETASSDDEDVAHTSFLIATPVSFYAPESKPQMISIEPPACQNSKGRATETEQRREPTSITGQTSPKSSPSNLGMKNRISSLKLGKYSKKRSSTQPASESTFPIKTKFSNASIHSLSNLTWRSGSALSSNSEPEPHCSAASTESRSATPFPQHRRSLLPSPRMSEQRSTRNRHQTMERRVINEAMFEGNTRGTDDRRTSKAKKKDIIPPVPQITGLAISSDVSSPGSVESSPNSFPSTPLRDPRLTPKPPFPTHGASRRGSSIKSPINSSPSPITPMDLSPNFPFPDIPNSDSLQTATKRRGFHERTHSINSLTSTSSMPNFASLDNSSPRSATRRYKQRFYPADDFPSERHPSHESVNPAILKANSRNTYTFTPRGSISTANLSNLSSVSTATSRSNSPADGNNLSWNYHTGTWNPSEAPGADSVKAPLRKSAHSKGIKRLYETSESVSRVGTKAFSGLGSILRKKHVASGDERWG
ncbi:hypothetical protein BDDG_08859 [Blastomyces dermatitidis ATCC 18188]|uniref:Uncharacterized protein n=1 Tax=Ajellomyces dermatitidis (strain ATCC 18188 / CBS 674.68) TaxID=653446 RepID=F2TRQ1_AJEDA|nr:hypothetical protein BDDG_08859 [Blastomyces dermatitidis ATCC 18188]